MADYKPISQLPWQVTQDEFLRSAQSIGGDGACCAFVIDASIPTSARSGYAALVIAYARADEPVCILDDGSAILLVREGGPTAGHVVAHRIIEQMRRLALDQTIRAGVAPLGDDAQAAMAQARDAAAAAEAGTVAAAP